MVSTLVDSQFLLGLRDRKLSIKVELNHFNVNFILTYNIYVVKWNYFTTIFLILLSFFSKGGSLGVLPLGEKGRKDHSLPLLHAHSGIYHFSSLLSKLLSVFLWVTSGDKNSTLQVAVKHDWHVCSQHMFGLPLKMKGIQSTPLIAGTAGTSSLCPY